MAFRQARLFEGAEPGAHGRPPVPAGDTDPLLGYLNGAPIVLAARGFDRDVIDPAGPSNVPMTFHTDGAWIWPGAVAYYLRVHGVPPEPELVEHIRSRHFQVPEVPEQAKDAAVSTITGSPPPPPPTPSAPAPSAPPAQAVPVSSAPPSPPAPAHGSPATPPVPPPGAPQTPAVFAPGAPPSPSVPAAEAPATSPVPSGPAADRGGPIQPLAGEPPLSLYRDLRETTLPPGTELDRIGGPQGNVAYALGTDWGRRSLPADWAGRPRQIYRVQRPVRALTGIAIPWFDQPGGGVAFVLPASMAALVADGTLTEV
ncbi:TNT domain-containing protein [Thermomonospora umbrina]|uniref:Uncharacterized protein DUF4237 n=1 Tax=Thermomonospora umbrina TaxID=111806 RepID=A0A3D9SQ19_9ACTN|nr:TNT domain-containing protein [Thermomonospora umbrina]REE96570.1 uncharacterized protein DUF4237 [Thermomonospora umbrina]